MDAHQVAIAALREVAEPASHHCEEKVASSRSGNHMKTDLIEDDTAAVAHHLLQSASGNSGIAATGPIRDSQDSAPLSNSSNHSQSTTEGHEAASPPTPYSEEYSSQGTNYGFQLSQLSQLAAAQPPMSEEGAHPNGGIAPTAGQKRTANGEVKLPSPDRNHQSNGAHSRNPSMVSNVSSAASSRMGELSSELRTRLSYAMVKVNKGWQSNSIDEVESLASQASSPTSSTSTLHGRRSLTSPREAIASMQSQNSAQTNSSMQVTAGDFDLYSRPEPQPQTGTYESFWRTHQATAPPISRVTLAPSADIRPQPPSRRSHTPKFAKQPALPGQGSVSSIPLTPCLIETLQPPSQKTIQEQDAIETLLFMSSPGNSSHHLPPRTNPTSPQASPLRMEFQQDRPRGAQGRRVGFKEVVSMEPERRKMGMSMGSVNAGARARRREKGTRDAIDQLIDDVVSSSDDEIVISYNPRRVAAGRV